MGILSKSAAEPAAATPESLRDELIEARSEQDAAIEQAQTVYAGVKASVVQRATDRVRAVGGLLDDLNAEKSALDEILANAGEVVA
jgi:hypothetical protein